MSGHTWDIYVGCTMEGGQVVNLGNTKLNYRLINNDNGVFHNTYKCGIMNAKFKLQCGIVSTKLFAWLMITICYEMVGPLTFM